MGVRRPSRRNKNRVIISGDSGHPGRVNMSCRGEAADIQMQAILKAIETRGRVEVGDSVFEYMGSSEDPDGELRSDVG